ncbi:MAG: hypothetical protein GEV08_05925 [Acidimicrobiia bacterium]|nr:hypothetical protein [Acidimicrobiia bacterium]
MTARELATGRGRPARRIELLGPMRVTVGGDEVEVRGTRRRAVLALLALQAGHVVATDAFLDAVWGAGPPPSGRHAVMSLMSRLRGDLGGSRAGIEQVGGGYRLVPSSWEVDVAEVRGQLRRAREVLASDASAAADELSSALVRWRGPALEEFASMGPLAAQGVALGELRMTIEEELIAARLDGGEGADLVEASFQAVLA